MNDVIELKGHLERIVQSTDGFPVDFDEAWQWVGYSTKQKGFEALERNFEKDIDYTSFNLTVKREIGGTIKIQINLTIDCFKAFCMMAGTPKGKEVRQYYLKIEKDWNNPEAVRLRAARMGVIEQMPWNYYPFFMRSDSFVTLRELRQGVDDGKITLEEFRRIILSRDTPNPVKVQLPLPEEAKPPGAVYAEAVQIIRNGKSLDQTVVQFAEKFLNITGDTSDVIIPQPLFECFLKETGSTLTRNKFIRRLQKVDYRIVYKLKKISGDAISVFFGIKYKN